MVNSHSLHSSVAAQYFHPLSISMIAFINIIEALLIGYFTFSANHWYKFHLNFNFLRKGLTMSAMFLSAPLSFLKIKEIK